MTQPSLEQQQSEKGGGREKRDCNKLHAPLQKHTYQKPQKNSNVVEGNLGINQMTLDGFWKRPYRAGRVP